MFASGEAVGQLARRLSTMLLALEEHALLMVCTSKFEDRPKPAVSQLINIHHRYLLIAAGSVRGELAARTYPISKRVSLGRACPSYAPPLQLDERWIVLKLVTVQTEAV